MRPYVIGVDGCRKGWVAVLLPCEIDRVEFRVHGSFFSVLEDHSEAVSIAVDIPIGLTESFQSRRCDREARTLIGPRRSSVFPSPDRRLLKLATYAEANGFSRISCGKGISQQCFRILSKIAEVDSLMAPPMQARVFEVHPEVCFWAASGQQTLKYPKRKAEGYEERRNILKRVIPDTEIPLRGEVAKSCPGAQADDVLDAMIAAWTARRHASKKSKRIPHDPEYDPRGLRMEMIF